MELTRKYEVFDLTLVRENRVGWTQDGLRVFDRRIGMAEK